MFNFSAKIHKIGVNPVVDPPDEVLARIFEQAKKSKGPIPVCGLLNGVSFLQTLVRYGSWRLYINGPMLKNSAVKVGDLVDIGIEFDPIVRITPMPEGLDKAFAEHEEAGTVFGKLTPSRQKEILRYLGSLKSQESLNRNLEKVLAQLKGSTSEPPPAFMARRAK